MISFFPSTSPSPPPTLAQHSNPKVSSPCLLVLPRRRSLLLHGSFAPLLSSPFAQALASEPLTAQPSSTSSFIVPKGIVDTDDWYRFQGDGFAVSIPPDFDDISEPEDYSSGSSLYGERAKPKTFAARFASPDRSEVLSVVIRQASALRLSFFATKDITDLGSIRDAASIFVPGGAKLYAARTIKSTDAESESSRAYYYYEFSSRDNYIAMVAAASSGQVYVVGATAPQSKWKIDGRKLRSAAVSFSLL